MNSAMEQAMLDELLGDLDGSCLDANLMKSSPHQKSIPPVKDYTISPEEEQAMLDCVLDSISDGYMTSPLKPPDATPIRKPLGPIPLNIAQPMLKSIKENPPFVV
jgi:hypothetical protein